MRVFVTGATGFIGSAIVPELLAAGHEVVGLARSDQATAAVAPACGEAHRGDLEDLDSIRAAPAAGDGVIHTAYNHDFSQIQEAAQANLRAIETLGSALDGSARPLVITTGVALIGPGTVVSRCTHPVPRTRWRCASVPPGARARPAGSVYHAVADEGVPTRQIAEATGWHLDLDVVSIAPAQAAEHFGWIGPFVVLDAPASSTLTQRRLGWEPTDPVLIADLGHGHYFQALHTQAA
ncbi:MAG: NAD-dependent epimerase/dehydratase family protein [Solirubrobacteraceae bacterium]